MIDIIGDMHGHAGKLEELLHKMGYRKQNNYYSHPTRKVLFLGDYIDRGPQIRETLEIVKGMVDNGNAIALLGNHEYNALCFHTQEREGGHLRKHSIKNIIQHYQTLKQFQNRQNEYENYLEWFKTLPLFYETEEFRAVHACWATKEINYLKSRLGEDGLTDELIYESVEIGSTLHDAIGHTLKGKEVDMPKGRFFTDKDGTMRSEIRIKWWENPLEMTLTEISIEPLSISRDTPLDLTTFGDTDYYGEDQKPVFFGHYWLRGEPSLYRENICCLDYSVANKGYLAAYQFDGEQELDPEKIIFV